MRSTAEKVMWVAIGAAIGAGIALLYAPRTGKDARKYLRKKATHAREAIADTSEHIRDTLVETGGQVVDAGRGVYRKASTAAEGAADILGRGYRAVRG